MKTLLFAFCFIPLSLFGYRDGAPAGLTGAPGEGTCASCHSGTPNTRGGSVTAQFPTFLTYTAGLKQLITVRVNNGASSNIATGFEATIRRADTNQTTGTVSPLSRVKVISNGGNDYLEHNDRSPDRVYQFEWTPSANVGNVILYVSAVAGSNDGQASVADEVYTAQYTLTPDTRGVPGGYRWDFLTGTGTPSAATGISTDSRVVGTYQNGGQTRGFLRNADGTVVLVDVPGATGTSPAGVNSAGMVVGSYVNAAGKTVGFLRGADGSYKTYDVGGSTATALVGVTDSGDILATATGGSTVQAAWLFPTLELKQVIPFIPTGVSANGTLFGGAATPVYGSGAYLQVVRPDGSSIVFPSPCGPSVYCTASGWTNDFGESILEVADLHAGSGTSLQIPGQPSWSLGSTFDETGPSAASGINNLREVAATGRATSGGANTALVLRPCPATVTTTNVNVSAIGGNPSVALSSSADCHWRAVSNAEWITVTTPRGSGSSAIPLQVQANPSSKGRNGTALIGSTVVTVSQDGAACVASFGNGLLLVDSRGQTGTVGVTAPAGCSWTVTSSVPWIQVMTSNGTGNQTVAFVVDTNNTASARSGNLSLPGGATFTVNEAASPLCTFTVNGPNTAFGIGGGTANFMVTTSPGCGWLASSNASWITFGTSQTLNATGSTSSAITVAGNAGGNSRIGNVTVAGTSFTITQAGATVSGLGFVAVTPCRLVDTRAPEGKTGAFGPPFLTGSSTREVPVPSGSCGIPSTARAYSVNVTVVPRGPLSFLTLWPTGQVRPLVSTLNAFEGQVIANAAIVPAGTNGSITAFVTDATDLIIDVNGYFTDAPGALVFYPMTPCRVVDTRVGTGGPGGAFGPPSLAAGQDRSFPVRSSTCNIPATAGAYVFNITVVPGHPLDYITAWPSGQTRPFVSVQNSPQGRVLANAAIVPAGTNGDISLFGLQSTDVVVDINGYFAPPGQGGGQRFYPVTPCRLADTRVGSPIVAGQTSRLFAAAGLCGVPAGASAASLNLTVVPPGYLGFVTLYPGPALPFASTLNAWEGQVAANAAIVRLDGSGGVNAYVSNATHVILDVNGYFGQ